jgi:hypothetical protein
MTADQIAEANYAAALDQRGAFPSLAAALESHEDNAFDTAAAEGVDTFDMIAAWNRQAEKHDTEKA